MPKTFKPPGNQIGPNFTGMKIKKEIPKEDEKDQSQSWILSQRQDELGASTHYKAGDLGMDGYYVYFTRNSDNNVCMWPVTKKAIFRQIDKPIADAEININKTLTLMKRRKGKKKIKPTKGDDDKDKDSLSDLVNKHSGDEWHDGDSMDGFAHNDPRELEKKDPEAQAKEDFKDMDMMVKRAAPDNEGPEDDFTDDDSDDDDVSDYSK